MKRFILQYEYECPFREYFFLSTSFPQLHTAVLLTVISNNNEISVKTINFEPVIRAEKGKYSYGNKGHSVFEPLRSCQD
jgi:hypothetical protein